MDKGKRDGSQGSMGRQTQTQTQTQETDVNEDRRPRGGRPETRIMSVRELTVRSGPPDTDHPVHRRKAQHVRPSETRQRPTAMLRKERKESRRSS